MRNFPAAFATELAKKTGITPVWVLRMTVDGVVYDLSDSAITFPGGMANGFSSTLPWVGSWGEVRESISGNIGEMLVSDFSVTVYVEQDIPDNIRHLALNHNLESSLVELYLWLDGLTAATPPQRVFCGYVKDIEIPDETQVNLTLEDESTRFQAYLGTQISSEQYPLCDPDDVGKMIPIVFGSVDKLPARCVDSGWVTTASMLMLATDETITVSELPAYSVLNKIISIEDEQLYIQSVSGLVLTVNRGYNNTTVVTHDKGVLVIEKKTTPLVYLLADHALDSIGKIYARVSGCDIDITADCTKYLGTTGNQLAAYPGKAAITIPDFVSLSSRILLEAEDSITLSDPLHSHVAGTATTVTPVSLQQTLADLGLRRAEVNLRYVSGGYKEYWRSVYWSLPVPPGAILSSTITVTVSMPPFSKIYFAGIFVGATGAGQRWVNQEVSFSFSHQTQASAMQISGRVIEIVLYLGGGSPTNYDHILANSATVSAGKRVLTYNSTSSANVSISGSASGVAKTGTVSLSGNSVADVTVGDAILVDVTRNITSPFAVFSNLLTTYFADNSLVQTGTFPSGYALNGAITEYKKAIEWFDYLSFQCRAFFRKMGGVSRLIVRDVNPAPVGTIPACCLTDDGIKSLSYKKAPTSDVISKISVYYNRNWSDTNRQSSAYTASLKTTDDNSISIFGVQEQPDLFLFDFVTDAAMANDLAQFYCDFYATRKWKISFSTFLDNARFEFGDVVSIPFADNLTGVIVEAGLAPGNLGSMDKMQFVVDAAVLPETNPYALTTVAGEPLVTKGREGINYV